MELIMTWDGEIHRVELNDGVHLVGRSPDAGLRIPVATISGRHARLRVEGRQLYVEDLGSTNGTDIDGNAIGPPQGEVEVPPGMTVRFAGVPLWREEDGSQAPPDEDEDTASFKLGLSDESHLMTQSSYHIQEGYSETARSRIAEMLSSLVELVASNRPEEELAHAACEYVARWVDADRVIMLEDSGEGTQPAPVAHWTRGNQPDDRIRLSNTLIQQVLNRRQSVLIADMDADPDLKGQASIMALKLRSAMAVPLFDNERVRGILYVDSARSGVRFTDDKLQLLTAAANAVAVKMRNLSLEGEIRRAARIQKAMLPAELPKTIGYELLAHQVMCRSVGGDLYHVLERPNGKLLIALGDVAGKGTPAALAMTAAMILIGTLAEIGDDLGSMIDLMQRKLFEGLAPEQYLTLFLAELDRETGRFSYVNAGHEPPLIVRADGHVDRLDSTGLPIALMEMCNAQVAYAELRPGDLLSVFSDGIPEATRDGEDFLGLDEVTEILTKQREDDLESISVNIQRAVDRYLGGGHPSDDVTLMIVRRGASAVMEEGLGA